VKMSLVHLLQVKAGTVMVIVPNVDTWNQSTNHPLIAPL